MSVRPNKDEPEARRDWWTRAEAAEAETARLREALAGTEPPYRIAGIPPGIISANDCDVTDGVLAALNLLAYEYAPRRKET